MCAAPLSAHWRGRAELSYDNCMHTSSCFLVPIVMYKGEAVLQLSSANWARFGETRQRETTSAHPRDDCFLQGRFAKPKQRNLFILWGVPPAGPIASQSWSVWPCTSWQKIHKILCLLSASCLAKGPPLEKKHATPRFASYPLPRWIQGGHWAVEWCKTMYSMWPNLSYIIFETICCCMIQNCGK